MNRYISLLVIIFIFQYCSVAKKTVSNNKFTYLIKVIAWHEAARRLILLESTDTPDSSSKEIHNQDNGYTVKYFSNNNLTFSKVFNKADNQTEEIRYSKDGAFEIRWHFCEKDKIISEEIFYRKNAYGYFAKRQCNKPISEEGCLIENNRIGIWRNFGAAGKSRDTNYGMEYLADSLPSLSSLKE
jgi:hypothetical protein